MQPTLWAVVLDFVEANVWYILFGLLTMLLGALTQNLAERIVAPRRFHS